jgi:hypothetical protein
MSLPENIFLCVSWINRRNQLKVNKFKISKINNTIRDNTIKYILNIILQLVL